MPVFFVPPDSIADQVITIRGPLIRHIRDSLRARAGEDIHVATEAGMRYRGRIRSVTGSEITAEILDRSTAPLRQTPALLLAHALIKPDRMDWVIQKATELGVEEIIPLLTRRGVVRPNDARISAQQGRWNRIALEAAQQSERWTLPRIHTPTPCLEFLAQRRPTATALILREREPGLSLRDVPLPTDPTLSVILAIGPEGGWDPDEMACAVHSGVLPVSLGARILRSETASLAALSVLQSRLGELG